MLFNSFLFITLFVFFVFLFYFIKHSYGYKLAFLLLVAFSFYFYGYYNWSYIFLILISLCFNFAFSLALHQNKSRILLFFAIFFNLGLLAYYKYANFLVNQLTKFSKGAITIHLPEIILPIAISFFTIEQIAYLIDIHNGKAKLNSFFDYLLFVTFFPHLLAGPIILNQFFLQQLNKTKNSKIPYYRIIVGLSFFSIGLFKKVIIADNLDGISSLGFQGVQSGMIFFGTAWLSLLAYSFQIYFDFSGYSDMALGLAFVLGITLPFNFNSPYKARSVIEFWQRWHMTLTYFLRRFLYIPMGGNRKGKLSQYKNIFVVMVIAGIWHGAGWNFMFWGTIHGLMIIVNHTWRQFNKISIKAPFSAHLSRILTFLLVTLAWVPFKCRTILETKNYYMSLFNNLKVGAWTYTDLIRDHFITPLSLAVSNGQLLKIYVIMLKNVYWANTLVFLLAAFMIFLCKNSQEIILNRYFIYKQGRLRIAHLLFIANIISIALMYSIRTSSIEFIYFRF